VRKSHRLVGHTVYVECKSGYRSDGPEAMRPVGETEWVMALQPTEGFVDGIVGFADLTIGSPVGDVLDAHIAAGRGRFRGVRFNAAADSSPELPTSHHGAEPGLLGSKSFLQGLIQLESRELSFDLWMYFHQLPDLVTLAQAHPEVTIVLNHLGGPMGIGPYRYRRDEVLAAWMDGMRQVAECPNVVVKLGGLGMLSSGTEWSKSVDRPDSSQIATHWGPQIRWCIETFGPDRCMFESNFPGDRHVFSYSACWNSYVRLTEELSESERHELFWGTAMRVYRLIP
jgi:L-fuconolactonase